MTIFRAADAVAHVGLHEQVHRLVLVVVGAGIVRAGDLVERNAPIDGRGIGRDQDVPLGHAVVVLDLLHRLMARMA